MPATRTRARMSDGLSDSPEDAMRISVRLDRERAKKLEGLSARTHQTTSEIVKRAIDLYHEQAGATEHPYEVLTRAGFVAYGEGRPVSSTDKTGLFEHFGAYRWHDRERFENRLLDS